MIFPRIMSPGILATIQHVDFIDSQEVIVKGLLEAFCIIVGREIEKGGVVDVDGEVVLLFGYGGVSGLFG